MIGINRFHFQLKTQLSKKRIRLLFLNRRLIQAPPWPLYSTLRKETYIIVCLVVSNLISQELLATVFKVLLDSAVAMRIYAQIPILSKLTIWKTEWVLFSRHSIFYFLLFSRYSWIYCWSEQSLSNREDSGTNGLWLIRYWLHCLCSTYSVHTQNFLDRNGRKVTKRM